MSSITLYNYELEDSCYRVRMLLKMLGLEYTTFAVDMVPGNEHKSPAMLALNPLGEIPILTDGELTLYGAEAIMTYLARAYDKSENWFPLSAAALGQTMQWLAFSAGPLKAAMTARQVSLFGLPGDFETLKAQSRKAFRIMDDHMTLRQIDGKDWFVGDGPTLADLTLFPAFALSRDYGIDHDEFPALRIWIRRLRALPGFITMPGIPDYH